MANASGNERLTWVVRRNIGSASEKKVFDAIDYLVNQGQLDGSERSDDLERNGVDVLAKRSSKKYKLSVKSSKDAMKDELEKHPERYRTKDKIFIIPKRDETTEILGKRISRKIDEFEERMHKK